MMFNRVLLDEQRDQIKHAVRDYGCPKCGGHLDVDPDGQCKIDADGLTESPWICENADCKTKLKTVTHDMEGLLTVHIDGHTHFMD